MSRSSPTQTRARISTHACSQRSFKAGVRRSAPLRRFSVSCSCRPGANPLTASLVCARLRCRRCASTWSATQRMQIMEQGAISIHHQNNTLACGLATLPLLSFTSNPRTRTPGSPPRSEHIVLWSHRQPRRTPCLWLSISTTSRASSRPIYTRGITAGAQLLGSTVLQITWGWRRTCAVGCRCSQAGGIG